MAYEKQTWNCGDTITADKLNHIEDGIADASGGGGSDIFTVNLTIDPESPSQSPTVDKTFAEIKSAILSGKNVLANIKTIYQGALLGVSSIAQVSYATQEDVIRFISIGYRYDSETETLVDLDATEIRMNSDNSTTMNTYHGEFPTA